MSRVTTKICDVCHERIDNIGDPSITIMNVDRPDVLYDFHDRCFEEMEPRDVAKMFLDLYDSLNLIEHQG